MLWLVSGSEKVSEKRTEGINALLAYVGSSA